MPETLEVFTKMRCMNLLLTFDIFTSVF